jgi:hypothetical protein
MIRNRVPANANAVLRRQLKKGVRAGNVVNRTQAISQLQRTATTGTVQTKKKVNALEGMGLPILTKSQSGSHGSKIGSLSGDAFQKASSSPRVNYGPIAELSLSSMVTLSTQPIAVLIPVIRLTLTTNLCKKSILHSV